eukprot:gene18031-25274_t
MNSMQTKNGITSHVKFKQSTSIIAASVVLPILFPEPLPPTLFPVNIVEKIRIMVSLIQVLFPTTVISLDLVNTIVHESFLAASTEFGVAEAITWGDNFSWPSLVHTRDLSRFNMMHGNLIDMVRDIRTSNGADRLNPSRVIAFLDSADDDYAALMSIAKGIVVPTPFPFQSNSSPPALRTLYKQVHCAVNKMLFSLWEIDLVFILPTSVALTIPNIHFSPNHWTSKRGKQSGRPIFDASDTKAGALNNEQVKQIIKERYGPIHHPTLQELMNMILFWEASLSATSSNNRIILWKADLAR